MSEFKPIETQEEFDEKIKERIDREAKKWKDKVAELETENTALKDSVSELTGKNEDLTKSLEENKESGSKEIDDLKAKLKGYGTDSAKKKIAREYRIPEELADRIKGEDEESMKKDAEALSELISQNQTTPPDPDPERGKEGSSESATKALLESLTEGE